MLARRRALVFTLYALPLAACASLLVSFVAYAGGTWWDRGAEGASVIDTFLCDLMGRRSVSGATNTLGAVLGRGGMGLFAVALVPGWWLAGELGEARGAAPPFSPSARRALRLGRTLGLVGLAPLLFALATAGDWLHAVVIPWAALVELIALAGITATTLGVPATRGVGLAGLFLGTLVLAGMAFYWPTMAYGELAHRGLPGLQKLAVVALVAWLFAVARASRAE